VQTAFDRKARKGVAKDAKKGLLGAKWPMGKQIPPASAVLGVGMTREWKSDQEDTRTST